MELGYWLMEFKLAKNNEEAENLCVRGSVRIDGSTISNARYIPQAGSILRTLESLYSYQIPERAEIVPLG